MGVFLVIVHLADKCLEITFEQTIAKGDNKKSETGQSGKTNIFPSGTGVGVGMDSRIYPTDIIISPTNIVPLKLLVLSAIIPPGKQNRRSRNKR